MRLPKLTCSFLLIIILVICNVAASAQSVPDSIIKKIDSIFKHWNNTSTPGCAIAIVRNDSILYKKGYGIANLEYGISISPETIFHMASVSKQFTAYSIVLLERLGKLKLDDDIHKYLTWFPDLKKKITIRNLLNHTSGIRDQWQLLAISGTRLDDVITQDHIIKILGKQAALNFNPGERFLYSNSGFTMLAEIVKVISGKSFRDFTDSAIFKPLGMNSTHFHDDYKEIVKNRSYSYDRPDSNHFSNSILSYSNAGATSLFTNINDMCLWIMNFYNHKVGDQHDIDRLTEKGKLNNGKEISYALGISVGKYKSWKEFSHGGGDAGYRTYITVLPDLKMGFAIFSNLGDFNTGQKTYELADLFISDTTQKKAAVKPAQKDSALAILSDTGSFKKFTGSYISPDGLHFNFNVYNRKVYVTANEQNYLLEKERKDTFVVFNFPDVKFAFSLKSPHDTIVDFIRGDEISQMIKIIEDTLHTDKQMQTYVGNYFCPELDCKYGIVLKDHHLYLTNNKYNDTKLTLIGEDHLVNNLWWMSHLLVKYDANHTVTGFEVNDGRILHLKFEKIK